MSVASQESIAGYYVLVKSEMAYMSRTALILAWGWPGSGAGSGETEEREEAFPDKDCTETRLGALMSSIFGGSERQPDCIDICLWRMCKINLHT